jgi:ketosteroid isomerase-like protein
LQGLPSILVNTHYSGRGRSSGIPVDLEMFSLIVVRDGKALSYRDYETWAVALEAAGLRE